MESAIRVENLRKEYGKTTVLDGIDFEVRQGEVLGFLGPNGAGKTTTLEILVGIIHASSGNISFFGEPVTYPLSDEIKSRIGMSFQAGGLYDDLTVRETLNVFASLYDTAANIDECIKAVDLTKQTKKKVRHLSGGQQQRLVFAMSIINDPDVIFLDEPTVGLDPKNRHDIWGLIRRMQEEGKTIILTSHYMDEIEELADRILFLHNGKIRVQGTIAQVQRAIGKEGESLEDTIIQLDTR